MADITPSEIWEALKPIQKDYSGYSCNGVNLVGDQASIKAAVDWHHYASQAEFFRQAFNDQEKRADGLAVQVDELKKLLKNFHDNTVQRIRRVPMNGTIARDEYEQVCRVLGLEALPSGAATPQAKYTVGLDAGNNRNRRIHGPNGQVCKVYSYHAEEVQEKAEKIAAALEQANVVV